MMATAQSTKADLDSFLDAALDAYRNETAHDILAEPSTEKLKTVDDLHNLLEAKSRSFEDFRNRHRSVWSRLQNVASPVARLGKIAQGPIQVAPFGPAISAFFGGMVFLLSACDDVSNAYDWIEDVFRELQGFSERLAQYARSDMDFVMQRRATAILVFFLRVIGRSETLIRSKRFKRYIRSVFLGEDSKTKELLDDLHKETQGELEYVVATIYSSSRATLQATARIEQRQAENTEKILASIQENKKDNDRQWHKDHQLPSLETDAIKEVHKMYTSCSEQILDGSGSWLENEDLYQAWERREAPLLWIFGGPGAGKSYLMTRTITKLRAKYDPQSDEFHGTAVGYFFIKEGRSIQQDPRAILKTWAWQMALSDQVYARHAAAVCSSEEPLGGTADIWKRLFLDFYKALKYADHHALLLLDGLDEAPTQARCELLVLFERLINSSKPQNKNKARIQVAVFSRLDIRSDMFFLMQQKYIEVTSFKNSDDMQTYIKSRLERFSVIHVWRQKKPHGLKEASKFARRVMRRVLDGADGMFLWAQLILQEMERKDQAQINKILQDPPKKLDDMIYRVFQRVSRDSDLDDDDVRKLLLWASFSFRDLSFLELHCILSLPHLSAETFVSGSIQLIPKPLLWNNIKGKLGSIIRIKYMDSYLSADDTLPSLEHQRKDSIQEDADTNNNDTAEPLDFGYDESDDDSEDEAESLHEDNSLSNFGLASPSVQPKSFDTKNRKVIKEHNEEYLNSLSARQATASATFSHLRVKGFLIRESRPYSQVYPSFNLKIDVDRAHVSMAIDCLGLLRLWSVVEQKPQVAIAYAMRYLADHLEAIDMTKVKTADRSIIVNGLAWMFGTEESTANLILSPILCAVEQAFAESTLRSTKFTKLVQQWLRDGVESKLFHDPTLEEWAIKASGSVKVLLHELAMSAARKWLKTPRIDCRLRYLSHWLVYVLRYTTSMNDAGEPQEENMGDWTVSGVRNIYRMTDKQILDLAEWAGFEKDCDWLTVVGVALLNTGHYDSATSHFKQALELEPSMHVPLEGMAICLREYGDYNGAANKLKQLISSLSDETPYRAVHQMQLAGLYAKSRGPQVFIEACEEALRLATRNGKSMHYGVCKNCIWNFAKLGRLDMVMVVLEELHSRKGDNNLSELVNFWVWGYELPYTKIARAFYDHGKPEFVMATADAAFEELTRNALKLSSYASFGLLVFKYVHGDGAEDETISRLETLIERYKARKRELRHVDIDALGRAVMLLSQLDFDKATEATTAEEIAHYEKRLRDLANTDAVDEAAGVVTIVSPIQYPSLLYGRWLRVHRQAPRSEWRRYFRSTIINQLALLDDADPSNDSVALRALADSLFLAGDRQNAAAVLAVLHWPTEQWLDGTRRPSYAQQKELTAEATAPDMSPDPSRATAENSVTTGKSSSNASSGQTSKLHVGRGNRFYCDACDILERDADEMYHCEICSTMDFCGNCMAKFKTGELAVRPCKPDHDFYRTWPVSDKDRHTAAVYENGEIHLRIEWLQALREEWSK